MTDRKGPENILVCVDGSEYTESSVAHAVWLSQLIGSEKVRVHYVTDVSKFRIPLVNEMGSSVGLQSCNGLFSELYEQEKANVRLIEDRVRKTFEESDSKVNYEFVADQGFPLDALKLEDVDYSHLVIGKRGENRAADASHLGSHMCDFIEHARQTCLVSSASYSPIARCLMLVFEESDLQLQLDYWKEFSVNFEFVIAIAEKKVSQSKISEAAEELEFRGLKVRVSEGIFENAESVRDLLQRKQCEAVSVVWNSAPKWLSFFKKGDLLPVMNICRVPFLIIPKEKN